MKYATILLLILGLAACTTSDKSREQSEKPANIIFLIGDGMGLSSISTTVYYGDEVSEFGRFQEIGLIKTHSATHKITDSAASGTAMATGKKTYNGAIGVDTARTALQNFTEAVSPLGWSTGVVATSTITHATPASYYAHVNNRMQEQDIAAQLLDSEIDFFAGGGIAHFNRRLDSADLFVTAREKGFIMDTVALGEPGSLSADQKYGYLLAGGGMPPLPGERNDFLPEATSLAIQYLSQNDQGFFLMVEGSQIDWAGHANNTEYLVAEMLDFEKTIAVALDFAEKDGNTLVVVTADHETGGVTLAAKLNEETGYGDSRIIDPSYATSGHSATLIPVFSYGPGAEAFKGMYENTELFHKMVMAAGAAD